MNGLEVIQGGGGQRHTSPEVEGLGRQLGRELAYFPFMAADEWSVARPGVRFVTGADKAASFHLRTTTERSDDEQRLSATHSPGQAAYWGQTSPRGGSRISVEFIYNTPRESSPP